MDKILVSFLNCLIFDQKEGECMKKQLILTGIILLIGMGISYTLGMHRGEINTKEQVIKQKEKEIKELKKAHDKELKVLKRTATTSANEEDLTEPERIVFNHYELLFRTNRFLDYEKNPDQSLTKEQTQDYEALIRSYWNQMNELQETNYKYHKLFLILYARTTDYYGAAGEYFQRYDMLKMNEERRKEEWEKVQEKKKEAEFEFSSFKERYFSSEDE